MPKPPSVPVLRFYWGYLKSFPATVRSAHEGIQYWVAFLLFILALLAPGALAWVVAWWKEEPVNQAWIATGLIAWGFVVILRQAGKDALAWKEKAHAATALAARNGKLQEEVIKLRATQAKPNQDLIDAIRRVDSMKFSVDVPLFDGSRFAPVPASRILKKLWKELATEEITAYHVFMTAVYPHEWHGHEEGERLLSALRLAGIVKRTGYYMWENWASVGEDGEASREKRGKYSLTELGRKTVVALIERRAAKS